MNAEQSAADNDRKHSPSVLSDMKTKPMTRILAVIALLFISTSLPAVTHVITAQASSRNGITSQHCFSALLDLAAKSKLWQEEEESDRLPKFLPKLKTRNRTHRYLFVLEDCTSRLTIHPGGWDGVSIEISFEEGTECAIISQASKDEFIDVFRKYYKEISLKIKGQLIAD